jgi:Prenyltransferase and squalene oxidase repeat
MKETLSIKLLKTLKNGKKKLSEEALCRMVGFVHSQRTDADSFMNKSGQEDIYYTLFGWMLSYVLGIRLDAKKMNVYLQRQDMVKMDLIHYAAFMRCRMMLTLMESGISRLLFKRLSPVEVKKLQEFESVPHNDPRSPYSQYIWLSLLEDAGHSVKNKEVLLDSLTEYHLSSGGYANVRSSEMATTNATVAGLAISGVLENYKENEDITYLKGLQEETGGFSAAIGSPLPDLLSTATSLFMLKCYEVMPAYSARNFIEAHWLDTGGFSATLLEERSDVEYTFYGLLALGTL